jgi:hypothetical protein
MGYVEKTAKPIPVTKEGIKEHFLAIITTCDLVSNVDSHILILPTITNGVLSRFVLWNVQLFEGSFLT